MSEWSAPSPACPDGSRLSLTVAMPPFKAAATTLELTGIVWRVDLYKEKVGRGQKCWDGRRRKKKDRWVLGRPQMLFHAHEL